MSIHICFPKVTRTFRGLRFCPVCRERERCEGFFEEWYGWTYEWDCGTVDRGGEYRRPPGDLIVDEHGRRPGWLRRRDRGLW